MEWWGTLIVLSGLVQALLAAALDRDRDFQPMVAFFCDRPAMHLPAMHRGVDDWVSDSSTTCLERMEDILHYCQKVYPDHNITNVVQASELVNIENWPMNVADRVHAHRVRPFRCLVGGFQSDALLVPQHCEFDHRHDQRLCKGFDHWNVVAENACGNKSMHLESFGMLLNCELGMFSGVEYVCCPNEISSVPLQPQEDDLPDSWEDEDFDDEEDEDFDDEDWDSEEDDDEDWDDEDEDEDEDEDSYDSSYYSSEESLDGDENTIDYYEAYLRQQPFPSQYNNEHKRFLVAKQWMKKNQQHKTTKLLQEWQAARDHVEEVRKTDQARADELSDQIAKRFQNLYASYQQEDEAEKQQLLAVHQQHVQSTLNERKRDAMDKYMQALDMGDTDKIYKYLQGYVKAEEKDRMHTVNHFEHVKYSDAHEALRIHPFIVNHLKLSEQRIDQALQLLSRYPDIEHSIRPEIDSFMRRFDAIATSIRNVVLPVPEVDDDEDSQEAVDLDDLADFADDNDLDEIDDDSFDNSIEVDDEGDDIREDEHDYEKEFAAHAMDDSMSINRQSQDVMHNTVRGSQVGSTLAIALGGVSVFVIIVVALVMVRRNSRARNDYNPGGYVEVDPSASPEERHVANMQMNGYENPTYKYFESAPKA